MSLEGTGDRTPSLASNLGPDAEKRYRVVWYPDACEAFVSRASGGGNAGSPVLDIRAQLDVSNAPNTGRLPQTLRRARGQIRRYSVANRCNVLVSPTYADEYLDRATNWETVNLDMRNLVRLMRSRWGEPFPYAFMAEEQPERSEREGVPVLNGMIMTPRLPRHVFDAVRESWGYGEGDGYNGIDIAPPGRGKRAGATYASKRLSEYASKRLGDLVPPGRQAYRVGQGFQPERRELEASSPRRGSAAEALEVWAEEAEGLRVVNLVEVTDDHGRPVDAAWALW